MTLKATLFEDKVVTVDDKTAALGGSFYDTPPRAYAPKPLQWCYEQLMLRPRALLLDVGASTGSYALLAKFHPDLTVHAFEPVLETHQVLKHNMVLNGLTNRVHAYPVAVGDINGSGVMNVVIPDGSKGLSMLGGIPAKHKLVQRVTVNVITLDAFCALHSIIPTFIKIDTEGSELAVLQGAARTIMAHHPDLLFEFSQENANQYEVDANETTALIEQWGYVWQNPDGSDIWAIHPEWNSIRKYQFAKDINP